MTGKVRVESHRIVFSCVLTGFLRFVKEGGGGRGKKSTGAGFPRAAVTQQVTPQSRSPSSGMLRKQNNVPLPVVHALILRTFEYVTLSGKGGIKVADGSWLVWLSGLSASL